MDYEIFEMRLSVYEFYLKMVNDKLLFISFNHGIAVGGETHTHYTHATINATTVC